MCWMMLPHRGQMEMKQRTGTRTRPQMRRVVPHVPHCKPLTLLVIRVLVTQGVLTLESHGSSLFAFDHRCMQTSTRLELLVWRCMQIQPSVVLCICCFDLSLNSCRALHTVVHCCTSYHSSPVNAQLGVRTQLPTPQDAAILLYTAPSLLPKAAKKETP